MRNLNLITLGSEKVKDKCTLSEVVRIDSVIIFHLTKP